MLVTVNNRLKFEIEIVHDLSCHPIDAAPSLFELYFYLVAADELTSPNGGKFY